MSQLALALPVVCCRYPCRNGAEPGDTRCSMHRGKEDRLAAKRTRKRRCIICKRLRRMFIDFYADVAGHEGRAMACKDCDDSDEHDGARTFGKHCARCFGMCWRRPLDGCPVCKEPHGPEDITEAWQAKREALISRWIEPASTDIDDEIGDDVARRGVVKLELAGDAFNGRKPRGGDLTGKVLAGCTVLGRAAAMLKREAWWLVDASCGHRDALEGWILKARERRGEKHMCGECRRSLGIRKSPSKSGEVRNDSV